jgi:hypothetical protein
LSETVPSETVRSKTAALQSLFKAVVDLVLRPTAGEILEAFCRADPLLLCKFLKGDTPPELVGSQFDLVMWISILRLRDGHGTPPIDPSLPCAPLLGKVFVASLRHKFLWREKRRYARLDSRWNV